MSKRQLPKVNPQGKLEEISKRRIRSLFDVDKFEIKREEENDTGIDWNVELIDEAYYTNYRFNLQLKAKVKYEVNKDGSISKSLETYNIKYLLDGAIPAFYVFYVKENDEIYYEYINDFVKKLETENPNWLTQDEHTCRFTKKLDTNALSRIYALVYQRSEELKENNETLIKINVILNNRSIKFDSYKEINQFLEVEGYQYLNKADSKLIIELHESTNSKENNGQYNFLVGLAYENVGQYVKAIEFFNTAVQKENDLHPELFEYLKYRKSLVEFNLGFIDLIEFRHKINTLSESNIIGLTLRLQQAREVYISNTDYEAFVKELDVIYNHLNANEVIRFYCRVEKLRVENSRLNAYYGQQAALIKANWIKTEASEIQDFAKKISNLILSWELDFQDLLNDIGVNDNKLIYFQCILIQYELIYEFNVSIKYINLPNTDIRFLVDLDLIVDKHLSEIVQYFRDINYFEELFSALEIKFRVLHFLERYNEADIINKELNELANRAYSKERKKNCENLIERMPHYFMKIEMEKIFGEGFYESEEWKNTQEWEKIIKQMQEHDEHEPNDITNIEEDFEIELFPIGNFSFKKSQVDIVFEILRIHSPSVIDTFLFMFDNSIVPIANILYDKVEMEGYREGNFADKGIENWKNIYRVRKAFFDNGFYRLK
jgi:hypothetical protein